MCFTKLRNIFVLIIFLILFSSNISVTHAIEDISCDTISGYQRGRPYCILRNLRGDANTTFHYVPSFFATLRTEILFDNCTLSSIPKGIFTAFPNVRAMYTWNSKIEIVSKSDFLNALNLRIIDFSKNRIEIIKHTTFFWAVDLEFIDLSQNNISKVESNAFQGLISLRTLHLQRNRLRQVLPGTFDFLIAVETIQLNENVIESIDEKLFSRNIKLKSILLSNNQIKSVAGSTFQHLQQLLYFDMHNNPTIGLDLLMVDAEYTNICSTNCKGCYIGRKTKKLFASNNTISYVIQNSTGLMVELDLSHNNLSFVKNLTNLCNLTDLDLSHNHIRDIEVGTFANMTNLESLRLNQSGLNKIVFGLFSHKPKLKILDISFNSLQTLDLKMFAALTNLTSFYIEGNNLTEVDLSEIKEYFPLLKKIGIAKNNWQCGKLAVAVKTLLNISIELNTSDLTTETSNIKGISCRDDSMDVSGTASETKCHVSLTSADDMSVIVKLVELKYEVAKASYNMTQISNKLDEMLENLKRKNYHTSAAP